MNNICLRKMNKDQHGTIKAISVSGELGRRLREMGLVPGTRIKICGRAPLYDPVAIRILDLVDAGKLKNPKDRYAEVDRCVSEEIFSRATQDDTKDDALAARSAETLLNLVREELTKPDTRSAYLYYNSALTLFKFFAPEDPRAPEVIKLWQDALTKNFKTGDNDYYARQMGWMLDVAAEKGNTALAAEARQEWRDTIEAIAKKYPGEAYRAVQQIVVNAAHYSPQSALVAEARAVFPDLEQRAGIKHMPEKMGSDDFLKMIGKKRGAFKP